VASYVTIDFETANPQRASACAVGVVRVDDDRITRAWSTLIDPETDFAPMNIAVHGIRPKDVVGAPTFPEVVAEIVATAEGTEALVAHNASFDVQVLARSAERYGLELAPISFACTRVLARHWWPGLPTYGLGYLVHQLELLARIGEGSHHEALWDARACQAIAELGLQTAGAVTLADALGAVSVRLGTLTVDGRYRGCVTRGGGGNFVPSALQPSPDAEPSPDHPLFGVVVCFTGNLEHLTRRDAAQLVVDAGGEVVNNMSRRVNLLVVGELDPERLAGHQTSSKVRKAAELAAEGHPIEVVDPADFAALVAR